jgi:hypothetical protein
MTVAADVQATFSFARAGAGRKLNLRICRCETTFPMFSVAPPAPGRGAQAALTDARDFPELRVRAKSFDFFRYCCVFA